MSYLVKNGNTTRPLLFTLIQSSDHITGLTGATPTVTICKNGGTFAAPAGAVSEVGNGVYKVAANATDANTNGPLVLHATAASADPCDKDYEVVAFDPDDAVRLGLSALPNAAAGANTGLPIVGTQVPNANSGAANGLPTLDANLTIGAMVKGYITTLLTETTVGWIAASVKKFFNLGSPTSTMNEITLVDTATNLTNAPTAGDFTATMKTSLNAATPQDTAGTTTLLARLTAARAGYLDNLNVGGPVSSHADMLAINQSASKHILLATVGQFAPGETYTVEARTFAAADGSAVNADTTPTLTATGTISGSLSANLSAATNPATGVYRWTYTPGATPTLEQIRFDVSATISAATFTLSAYAQTVDEPSVVWTPTDQAHLTAVFNKLPTNNIADETLVINATNAILTAVGTPQQANTAVTLPAIPTGWITATGIAAGALNGKGDWLLASNYTAPDNADIATILADVGTLVGANAVETGISLLQSHRAILAGICGVLTTSGANPEVYKNPAGTATRLSVANDAAGNRTAVTLTL